jgi:coniferyl-aldehyde dehydrogenase
MSDVQAAIDDRAAIEQLRKTFAQQKKAFTAQRYPALAERKAHLSALGAVVMRYRSRIREAMSADFAVHPEIFTDLVEVLGVVGRAAYTAENLESWAQPEERFADPGFVGSGKAFVQYQPKGVIGNIVPWNFPFDLSLGPLIDMLAAGNRVIMKPSEFTPACGEVLTEMIRETFDADRVCVAVGGIELAKTFASLRWDHLLYTGSPKIGRAIALAAAANLVPVTLELGGKCPAVLAADSLDRETVSHILGVKMIKNGQMCITVDYCLVPRSQVPKFVALAQSYMRETMPNYSSSEHCAGIISQAHYDRLLGLLDEAKRKGGKVVQLDEQGAFDRTTRRMPLSLVIDPPADSELMQEEIFGPILPVIPYDDIDEAIAGINAGERPLGLYVFTQDQALGEKMLRETISGGACINACAMQGAFPALGFGGVGQSGTGRHHGIDGFREFSNPRGVFVRGEGGALGTLLPPYGEFAKAAVSAAFGSAD